MPKIKIAFFELENWEEEYLREKLGKNKNLELKFFSEPISKRSIVKIKDVNILVCFIYSKVDQEIIKRLPKLKAVLTTSTGYDHIDIKYCACKNIKVSNVPFYGENTVAEHAFALILALSRKIIPSIDRTRRGDFRLTHLMGFDLKDRTIGLIGMGHIGAHVARMAAGFEMKTLVYDIKPDRQLAKKLNLKYVKLDYLLKHSDIISLHVPYNKFTHHIINEENIKKMKRGVYLINTARGGLVETNALIYGLHRNIIAGAGLDVLEEESCIKEEKELLTSTFQKTCNLKTALQNHLLIEHPKVVITPHNAFNSREALVRIMDTTIENIESCLKKRQKNVIK